MKYSLELSIDELKNSKTAIAPSFIFKGHAYLDDKRIDSDELATRVASVQSCEELTAFLPHLNGFYLWLEQRPNQIRAAVDHVRSQPLFYGLHDEKFYISDDAEWVRLKVCDHRMDPQAREEFQLTGYVTGQNTLFSRVKQLQAGECLIAKLTDSGPIVETHRYYRFLHSEPEGLNQQKLCTELDRLTVRAIERLIDYADGRQIVVPLSGGYDSRLIATMLKRLGYKNVLTFTYGVRGNKESAYSKRVADALGLDWHFVEYSESSWREVWQTSERWDYQKWASGWTSIAHLQDWLAVKILKEQRVVEPDCVFSPGHTGDFIAGGHIPAKTYQQSSFNISEAIDAVFSRHYNLAPRKLANSKRELWNDRILNLMERREISKPWEYADVYEKWEWQERQAKFICNSVRVYEFFGYDWWMPLWDMEFVEYWAKVPLEFRKERNSYINFVTYNFLSNTDKNDQINLKNSSDSYTRKFLIKLLHKFSIDPSVFIRLAPGLNKLLIDIIAKRDSLCWYSKYSHLNICALYAEGYKKVGINAYDILISFEEYLRRKR